jgi:RNA polymerase sigma factor (sigma-70 family)
MIDQGRKKRPEAIDNFSRQRDQRERSPEQTMIETEEAAKLRDCLQKLPEPFQSVARARIGGDSNDEIAARLGVPKDTVFTRWHRAVQKLTECVNGKAK